VEFAPPVDEQLVRDLARLDLDRPIAAVWRDLGAAASARGLPRIGYTTARRLVHAERLRRAHRGATVEVGALLAFTRVVAPTPEAIEAAYERAVERRLA
jgi:hypothetical protein